MNVQPWLVAAVALFLLGHAVILLFVYRLRQGEGFLPTGGTGSERAEAVVCQECGTENDGQYRYCRECAAELPGGLTGGSDGGTPDSRGMF